MAENDPVWSSSDVNNMDIVELCQIRDSIDEKLNDIKIKKFEDTYKKGLLKDILTGKYFNVRICFSQSKS